VSTTAVSDGALRALRDTVRGAVLTPTEEGYAARCLGWNRLSAHRPAVVVIPVDADDVVTAVRFATAERLGVGVQATGHGMVVPVDGVLVLTSELTELTVDPQRRTARVGAGCTWGQVLAATVPHDLAPLLGSSPTVGAVGYTLGGGLGWLARKHGAACDSARSFDLVTADARFRRADHETPELLRALRGGGGGAFGVVTAMEIDLVPVGSVYAGNLYYPPDAAGEVAERYARWTRDLSEDLTSSLVFLNVPPSPDVAPELRGRSFVVLRGCWSGDLDEGVAILDEWRGALPPVVDRWHIMPFGDCGVISDDRVEPTPVVVTGEWLSHVDRSVGERLAEATFPTTGPPVLRFSEVRHLGGAISRGDRRTSSFGHRHHPYFVDLVGVAVDHDPSTISDHETTALRSLGEAATGSAYVNYLDQDERRARTGDAYEADDRRRLAAFQRELDPDQLFRFGVDHLDASSTR
jgi:hypothetical protein